MPAKWESGSEHLELRDEFRSGELILRRYYDFGEPPGRREGWQVNHLAPEGEKQVLRGAGHDLRAIWDVLRRVNQEPEPREREVREVTSLGETSPYRDVPSRGKVQPKPDGERYFAAGRVVDYVETGYAVFRAQYITKSENAVKEYARRHPGMVAYRSPFSERPKLGTLIQVPRGRQKAIDRRFAEIELKREANRTFIVARYLGDPSDNPPEVWFNDGKSIKRGEERIACPLDGRSYPDLRSHPALYLVLEQTPYLPNIGLVVARYDAKPPAQAKARELEAQLVREQEANRPASDHGDRPQPPRSEPEWWRREGRALRERKEAQQRMPPNNP
jgi:hypothetical protein